MCVYEMFPGRQNYSSGNPMKMMGSSEVDQSSDRPSAKSASFLQKDT